MPASTANTFTRPSAGSDDSTDYLLGTLGWTWNLTGDSFIEREVQPQQGRELDRSRSPTSATGRPSIPRTPSGWALHHHRRPSSSAAPPPSARLVGGTDAGDQQPGLRARRAAGRPTRLFQGWFGANHDLRAGVTYEENSERLERRANGWGIVTWNATTRQFIGSYVSEQPPHTGRGEAYGVFLQDQFTLGQRTTLTAGLLVNKDIYYGEGLGSTPGTKTQGQDPHLRLGPADPAAPRHLLRAEPRSRRQALLQLRPLLQHREQVAGAAPPRPPASSPPGRPSTPPAT